MEQLKHLSMEEFTAVTASDAPAPGGGSVSALAGALAAALAEMVAHLTSGREKYTSVQVEMERILSELPPVRRKLLDAVDRDSRAFDQYMAALQMPKDSPAEKESRRAAMQEGLKAAVQVPMEVAETAAALFPILDLVVRCGNRNAVTDGMVGTLLARTAVLGALFNVRVNLASIQDAAFVRAVGVRADAAQELVLNWERQILTSVAWSGQL